MLNEPRNWKWAVPMMLSAPFGLMAYWMMQAETIWIAYLACIPGMATLVMGLLTVSNYIRYQVEWRTYVFDQRQRALNVTPVTLMADALRGMHPEAVKVLDKFGVRTRWGVKVDMENGDVDWMLLDTNVHLGFVEFVLNNSTTYGLYPLNRFSDKSRKWDPDGLVEDRDQYRQFEGWLCARMIVTRSFGENHAAQFIPPWTPDRVREAMRISDEMVEMWQPDPHPNPTPGPSPNGRAQFGEGGNGRKNFVDAKLDDLILLK